MVHQICSYLLFEQSHAPLHALLDHKTCTRSSRRRTLDLSSPRYSCKTQGSQAYQIRATVSNEDHGIVYKRPSLSKCSKAVCVLWDRFPFPWFRQVGPLWSLRGGRHRESESECECECKRTLRIIRARKREAIRQ
jgi:hypothetical protein